MVLDAVQVWHLSPAFSEVGHGRGQLWTFWFWETEERARSVIVARQL